MSLANRRLVVASLFSLGASLACSKTATQKGDAATSTRDADASKGDAGTDVAGTSPADALLDDAPAGDLPAGDAGTPVGNSVLQRGNHISRDGHFIQPTLTKAAVARFGRDFSFTAYFTGQQWATPLYFENGPGGKGIFVVATGANDVIAFDELTAKAIWTRNIGPAPAATGAGCGNVAPLGILSTPVIDPQSRTIYVAGTVGQKVIERHEIHALSVDDGSERAGWPLDVAKVTAGGAVPFMPPYQNQRGALALVGQILYVPYGGHAGDCGPYHGWVVAIDVGDPTKVGAWPTGGQGEGIWAAGGLSSDGNGVFATTGNNTVGAAVHLDSEEVVRITGLGVLDRKDQNLFYPAVWRAMDQVDADFGSSNPLYLEVPGATPSSYVVALSKDGHMYMLDSKNLGGMGGQVADLPTGQALRTVPAAYMTAQGAHVVFGTDNSSTCPGAPGTSAIMSVLIPAGAPPVPRVAWCVQRLGSGAPIVTTTDGKDDAVVWFVGPNTLIALDGDTGELLYTGAAQKQGCGNVRKWTSPIAVKGRIITGIDDALCAWAPQPASQADAATAD